MLVQNGAGTVTMDTGTMDCSQLPRKKKQARDCVLKVLLFCSVLNLDLCSSKKTVIVLPLGSLLSDWRKLVTHTEQTMGSHVRP